MASWPVETPCGRETASAQVIERIQLISIPCGHVAKCGGRPLVPSRQARQLAESQKTRESSIFSPHYPTPPANTIGGEGLFPEKYSHFGDWAVPFGGGGRSKWRQCAAGAHLELKGRRLSRANPANYGQSRPNDHFLFLHPVHLWVRKSKRPNHSHHAHSDPEQVEDRVGGVFLDEGAPREHDCVQRVKCPNKQKGTIWAEPTDERETEDSHQHADHLDGPEMASHRR